MLGTRKSLLRIDMTPDKLEVPGVSIRPPKGVWWLDEDFVPVRRQTELDGLGTLVLIRTTRDKAPRPGRSECEPSTSVRARSFRSTEALFAPTTRSRLSTG